MTKKTIFSGCTPVFTYCKTRVGLPLAMALMVGVTDVASAIEPFATCPSQAFIIQTPASTPVAYGVDLGTGSYATLSSDMGINASINGAGFSFIDNHLYGWDYQHQTLGIIGNDYRITPLDVTKDTASVNAGNFFVGDVAVNENAWYGYRKNHGLFRVDLDINSYPMTRVPGSQSFANINITDFAFHPDNGYIYAVTNGNNGQLLKIDPSSGQYEQLGTVITATSGGFTFGAQFFDPQGNLYLSNNGTGVIYRVHVDSVSPVAEIFSYGPSSSSNDGARCALAEVPVGDKVDFGDAPESYATLMADNGARHTIVDGFALGALVDNEADGYPAPLSDDASDGIDDDDGVSFPTGFEVGEDAVLLVTVTGSGYLNGWIDWNQDGTFDAHDLALTALPVSEGTRTVTVSVPSWATAGGTWARFRLSSVANIVPTGGVSDGEVEDYPLSITETGVTVSYYPSSSTFTTIAYEDLYPDKGDFDMNDVVINLRIATYSKDNRVRRVGLTVQLAAMGAGYHNGFAIQLPGIDRSNVQEAAIDWSIQGITQSTSPLEDGQSNAVVVFTSDLWQHVSGGTGCYYFRAEPGCGSNYRPTWEMVVPFNNPITMDQMPRLPFDPFIFATPNSARGLSANQAVGGNPGRQLEIHLKNKPPTDLFSPAFFGAGDDASSVGQSQYFQDSNGMAWAIEVPDTWKHPIENQRLDYVYPEFVGFAADPTGDTNPDWYLTPDNSKIFVD